MFTITIVHIGKSVRAQRTQRFMTQEEFARFIEAEQQRWKRRFVPRSVSHDDARA